MRAWLLVMLGLTLFWIPGFAAQSDSVDSEPLSPAPPDVPFGIGEHLKYRVKFGPFEVGKAEMLVAGIDTISQHPTYHVRFCIEGGTFFYTIDDRQESWMDVHSLASRRFLQDQRGSYERFREFQFDLENRRYRQDNGETGEIPPGALDDASFVYFVRTVPLEVGETYTWDRYYRFDRNPVILKVLRRETVEVPAGVFETIVIRPIIKTGGIYSEGGEAEIFVTADERRLPVQLKSKLKVGRLTLDLIEYEPGARVSPEMFGNR